MQTHPQQTPPAARRSAAAGRSSSSGQPPSPAPPPPAASAGASVAPGNRPASRRANNPIHHQQRRQQRGDPHHARRNLRQQLRRGADAERKQGDDDQKEPERIEDLRPRCATPGAVPGPTAHASLPASSLAAEAQGAQRTAQRPQRLVGGEDGASPCRACCSRRRVGVSIAVASRAVNGSSRIHSGASVNHRRVKRHPTLLPGGELAQGEIFIARQADGGEGAFPLLKAAGRKKKKRRFSSAVSAALTPGLWPSHSS